MKSINYLLALSALLVLGLQSCKKDVDDEAPVIETFEVENTTISAGSEIHADLDFSDNEALKSYKIDIHDNFDGHGHGKVGSSWSYQELVEISGKVYSDHKHIDVPEDAFSGPYHFTLYVLDAEGNQSDFEEVELMVTNSSTPVINITSLDASATNHVPKGTTLSLVGDITDADGIDEIVIELGTPTDESTVVADAFYDNDMDLGGSVTTYDLSALSPSIDVPSSTATGEYQLIFRVKDTTGNIAIASYVIHVM